MNVQVCISVLVSGVTSNVKHACAAKQP